MQLPTRTWSESTEDKTSAVHFLRFELPPVARDGVQGGGRITMGIDHPSYRHSLDPVPATAG